VTFLCSPSASRCRRRGDAARSRRGVEGDGARREGGEKEILRAKSFVGGVREMSARQLRLHRGDDDFLRAAEDDDEDADEDEDVASESSEEEKPVRRAVNPFAALLGSEDEEESEEEEEEEREEVEPEPAPEPEPEPEPERKQTSKRGGKKNRKQRELDAEEEEDIDALVKEVTGIDVSSPAPVKEGDGKTGKDEACASSLLAVDMRNMKAEDELKRIFGGRVISAVEAEEVGKAGGRSAAFRAKLNRRCTFSPYREQWANYRSEGLYMVSSGIMDASSRMSEFSFAWKDDYEQANFDFEIAVSSHDPNRLFHVLTRYPWHLETLLRISELYHYSGQAQESSEILERCLYACERAWHPNFVGAASKGLAHLDFSLAENKPMFESLFRHVIALTRRGCHKTALECGKLLLGLDHTDPKGALCMLSYFALRSGEEQWLLDFADTFGERRWVNDKWESHGSLLNFPDWAYSKAMALYTTAKDIQTADKALVSAMLYHPYAWTATLWKLEAAVSGDKEWQEILAHEHFDFANSALESRSLEHLSEIFATRHHLLWRPDQILSWAKRVARTTIKLVDSNKPSDILDGLTAADFATISLENWPASERNDFAHLIVEDFSDVVKRALPEDDPLANRPDLGNDAFSDTDED